MKTLNQFAFILCLLLIDPLGINLAKAQKTVHKDVPFLQDYSVKYYSTTEGLQLLKVASDRNGNIQILTSAGLMKPFDGQFLYPGTLEADKSYRPMAGKKIVDLASYQNQFVYLDDKSVLSNAWAGKLFSKHEMPTASLFTAGDDFTFLVSDGKTLKCIKDSKVLWTGNQTDPILDIRYSAANGLFWILGNQSLSTFSLKDKKLSKVFDGKGFTSFEVVEKGSKIIIGTKNGYLEWNTSSKKQIGELHTKLPSPEITCVKEINGKVWFGSDFGAFMLRPDGKFNYYNGERWLPGNKVIEIAEGPDASVLILTDKGLGQIFFKSMTLEEKALYFETQVRERHIRNGFNASWDGLKHGNLSTGYLSDSDNDGLWTSMYLGGEVFRYAVTKSEDALQNCLESLDAMERQYTINSNPVGFPARSFERSGYIKVLSDPDRWQHAKDPEWDWKATTSSDEAIGHIFVMAAIAELIDDPSVKLRSIHLIDILMQHIVDHELYLIDFDGKPTLWGRWNPEYVNARPENVGDRKICSSNIIAMLQTAYHFTKKEVFKQKAVELMDKYGYLKNLMRPMKEIGMAPADADELSKELSDAWNHSDDEMYFLGYWGLYRYALNEDLKAKFKDAIVDHWEIERPEKEGAWNIFTAMLGDRDYDLKEAVWYLQEHPLDLINWSIMNSHRKDIEKMEPNFRHQTLKEVLPPDERPVQRHNGNMFNIDRTGSNGTDEHSAGDIWLLPYWMGRYLGVISEPVKN
ncbi:MAG: hypothetical protein JZU47_07445 [Prolixibacteraceae bacterium]|nr:hypothetical protein [Prolixibacteraceae bacterium]